MSEKANTAASNRPPVFLSSEAHFLDGSALTPTAGGLVIDGADLYSLAIPEVVQGERPLVPVEGGWSAPGNRTGHISLLGHTECQPTTLGAELEHVRLSAEDGTYVDRPVGYLLAVKELYSFMGESGIEPTTDPAELQRRLWELVHAEVDDAESTGQLAAMLAVFGQAEPTEEQINPSPYITHLQNHLGKKIAFDPRQIFRVGSAQSHTGLSNSFAAIQAAEAFQYLTPILLAPTLCAPLVYGGVAGNLAHTAFTPKQVAHMQRVGITQADLKEPYLSWRYLLRRLGSPQAGVWQVPPPDEPTAYLARAHTQLAEGKTSSIDRLNGAHTDRLRLVLDGSGANTFEDCSPDPMLGNIDTLVPLQLVRSAIFTRLEAMALRGEDPREHVARMLGTVSLSRHARLKLSHHLTLRSVSRQGNDAEVYERRRPGEWLPELLELADAAPFIHLTSGDKRRLAGMYATWAETEGPLKEWCRRNKTDTPTPDAYFDLGLNNPAVYMAAQAAMLRRQGLAEADVVRTVEMSAAQALHRASKRQRGLVAA